MSNLSPDQWLALSPLLDEALGMTDDECSAWLSTLGAENPTLAGQLQILLQEHRVLSEEGFLEGRAIGIAESASRGRPNSWCVHAGIPNWPRRYGHGLVGGTKRRTI